MCQRYPVDAAKCSEGKFFLNFILINPAKVFGKAKYSLGGTVDRMTESAVLLKERQENSGKIMEISTSSRN